MSEHIARPEGGGASKSVTGQAELQSVVLIHWLFNPDTGLVVAHHQPILPMEPKSGGWFTWGPLAPRVVVAVT